MPGSGKSLRLPVQHPALLPSPNGARTRNSSNLYGRAIYLRIRPTDHPSRRLFLLFSNSCGILTASCFVPRFRLPAPSRRLKSELVPFQPPCSWRRLGSSTRSATGPPGRLACTPNSSNGAKLPPYALPLACVGDSLEQAMADESFASLGGQVGPPTFGVEGRLFSLGRRCHPSTGIGEAHFQGSPQWSILMLVFLQGCPCDLGCRGMEADE